MQALVDEGLVKVEKIGSGNWYWSFGGEEKRARETKLHGLGEEHARCEKVMRTLQDEVSLKEAEAGTSDDAKERAELKEEADRLQAEVGKLREEVEGYADMDPKALEAKQTASRTEHDRAERWTENCWSLESWLRGSLGVDREALENLQRQCYGKEYTEGEGLAELDSARS